MDWDKLRIFHAVADAGSLTHAGDTLHLSQSAVSRQIRALEESLNTTLFHRHARGLILTEQGELLFDATRSMTKRLDAAAARIRELMQKSGKEGAGLRIGVKKGGCAGMEYTMEYVTEVDPHDEVVEQDGARVMIAPMAQMFLFGTQIDYQTSLLESGFKFNNPNVKDECGCGESFTV